MANATNASTAAQQQVAPKKKNLIIYYYGSGKGKTTAALGLALRASGHNRRVLFAQFVKGDWKTGEDIALAKIDKLDHKKFGLGFVYKNDGAKKTAAHVAAAQHGLKFVKTNYRKYDIIVLDEISNAIKLGLLAVDDVKDTILAIGDKRTILLTGAPKITELVSLSDLVTEMKKVIHPFDSDIAAIKSIDW